MAARNDRRIEDRARRPSRPVRPPRGAGPAFPERVAVRREAGLLPYISLTSGSPVCPSPPTRPAWGRLPVRLWPFLAMLVWLTNCTCLAAADDTLLLRIQLDEQRRYSPRQICAECNRVLRMSYVLDEVSDEPVALAGADLLALAVARW